MYKFSFIISEDINIKLRELLDRAMEVKTDENYIRINILYNNEFIVVYLLCYVDAEDKQVKLHGWGSCRDKTIIQKLLGKLGISVKIRKKSLSLLDFARRIIEIYNSGIRDRESILSEIMRREQINENDVKRYLSMLINASKRRVISREIKLAAEIIS